MDDCLVDDAAEDDVGDTWFWRNTRDVGLSIAIWPLTWGLGFERVGDVYGSTYILALGPLQFELHANIGNPARGGLSEIEAYERAERYAAAKRGRNGR